MLITSFVAAVYAIVQYEDYKLAERTKLFCEYNQRYSTDKNIEEVIQWMLKVSIQDENGQIIGASPMRTYYNPGIYKKEMFMRFFEELNKRIDNKHISKSDAYDFFSYYALLFDRYREFRLDITDYKRQDKKEDEKDQNNTNECGQDKTNLWRGFSSFIEKMIEEEINRKKDDSNTK